MLFKNAENEKLAQCLFHVFNVKALKKHGTSRSDKIKIQYPNVTMSAVHNLANVSPLLFSQK